MSFPSNQAVVDVVIVGPNQPVTLADGSLSRNAMTVHNVSGVLFVKCGLGASSTSFSFRLGGNCTLSIEDYMGVVTAIKKAPDSLSPVYVTEII
jgi:hypothetical protein